MFPGSADSSFTLWMRIYTVYTVYSSMVFLFLCSLRATWYHANKTTNHWVVYAKTTLAHGRAVPCLITVWNLCVRSVAPMDTSCAAGVRWKRQLACSYEGFLTRFSHVHWRKPSCHAIGAMLSLCETRRVMSEEKGNSLTPKPKEQRLESGWQRPRSTERLSLLSFPLKA